MYQIDIFNLHVPNKVVVSNGITLQLPIYIVPRLPYLGLYHIRQINIPLKQPGKFTISIACSSSELL